VAEFLDALRRVAAGGTALDTEVVAQLLVRRGGDPLDNLTERERGVLALMAEGRSNAEIASALVITDSAVSKHINSIFAKLGLYPGDAGHRRVLAVLHYLGVDPALGHVSLASTAEQAPAHDCSSPFPGPPARRRGAQIHVSAPARGALRGGGRRWRQKCQTARRRSVASQPRFPSTGPSGAMPCCCSTRMN
jgi:DNA-binding CsgD family transcriptional regulator